MKTFDTERIVRASGALIALAAGVAALVTDGNESLETVLLMVGAVAAGLLAFDTAMDRRLRSFGPWVLLSVAPIMKTVPSVWAVLRSDSGLLAQRYELAGSLLFGASVFGAVALLARPAKALGASTSRFVAGVVGGTAVTGGLVGTSIAFLFDARLGSVTAGRALETPTWFVLSGLLAAAVIAAGHAEKLSLALGAALLTGCATAAVLALSTIGREIDAGWWILLFAGIAVAAAVTDGQLGIRSTRIRQSNAGVIVAIVVGLVGAASAISARSDRLAWEPGWALLAIASLVMFALAMISKPVDRAAGSGDDPMADAAQARAMAALQLDPHDSVLAPESSVEEFADQLDGRAARQPVMQVRNKGSEPTGRDDAESNAATAIVPDGAADRPSARELLAQEPVEPADDIRSEQSAAPVSPGPVQAAAATSELGDVQGRELPAQASATVQDPPLQEALTGLSDRNAVASAKAAAEVRDASPPQRHSLAPIEHAHYFDPSTGLLSAAGLQQALTQAFAVPRPAGHVTMLMFMIRDIDRIEERHGRLASAAVTREVAERVAALLPQGTAARFARSAYAVVFIEDLSNVAETSQWLARVLLQLRAPVEGGSLGDKIDVVAGMAQCYAGENVAQFVERANQGLVRAAQLPNPTLVAMP